MSDPIPVAQLRKHAERWMAYSDERGLMADTLLALIEVVDVAHGYHHRTGACPLCHGGPPPYHVGNDCPLARFTFGESP